MLKTSALIFGIILLALGILGFIPGVTDDRGMLLGIFHVNTLHNLVHVATGIVGILCGLASSHSSRLFFQIFGVIYSLIALLGLYYGDRPILDVLANNMADNLLHIAIAAYTLYMGFVYQKPHSLHPMNDRYDR